MEMSIEQFKQLPGKLFKSHRRRHAPGEMNKTEQRMADELAIEQAAGKVLWWSFEAMTFKLADGLRLTPDFIIMLPDGTIECRDTKGSGPVEEDALAKLKMAADRFWMFRWTWWRAAKRGNAWEVRTFGEKAGSA